MQCAIRWQDAVAWFPGTVVAAIGKEAHEALASPNDAVGALALELLCAAAPQFGAQLPGDRYDSPPTHTHTHPPRAALWRTVQCLDGCAAWPAHIA